MDRSELRVSDQKYSTITADPPWRYTNTSCQGAADVQYGTMSIEELCAIPVNEWANDPAHLYMWSTSSHLPEAFKVMEAWGFDYKCYLVWEKTYQNDRTYCGMGNYFRISTEIVIFGTKGTKVVDNRNLLNIFKAPRTRHSVKPEKFHDLVMKASDGPYLEMFARCNEDDLLLPNTSYGCRCSKCRLGWDTWGNESEGLLGLPL